MKKLKLISIFLGITSIGYSQATKFKPSISGSLGVTYEHYGLNLNPNNPTFYRPRRPYNQVRFTIAPTIQLGKNLSLPFNFNFATKPTNFLGPYAALSVIGSQNFLQFITNPLNNFSVNPKFKNTEVLLGTQYLNYTDLTTGDIGIFGAGADLKPRGNFVLKFFAGTSQQTINPVGPSFLGAYKRNHWMVQFGKAKEGKYKAVFTLAKGKDKNGSTTPFPLLPNPANTNPQESFVTSFLAEAKLNKGFYVEWEGAQGYFTTNTTAPIPPPNAMKSFEPFIVGTTATTRDFASNLGIGKKTKNFDIGVKAKYLGAGYQTMGFPFQQPDRFDATVNTRFNAWKDKNGGHKINVVGSIGNRINNLSSSTRANQLIANVNWYTQFNDQFNLNISFNNFGFNTTGTSLGLPTLRNVSNDLSIAPTYTWSNSKMSNMLSLNYSYSKYKELVSLPPLYTPTITVNNTHTAMLSYIPTFFDKKATPDFSVMYFYNQLPSFIMQLFTISSSIAVPLAKDKIKWKGQIQYTLGKNGSFTQNRNIVASTSVDYAITKKLQWNTFISSNHFLYGDELAPPATLIGANYLESFIRTGLIYKFK